MQAQHRIFETLTSPVGLDRLSALMAGEPLLHRTALADRDQWIGWDPRARRQQFHRVLALSRFLIRPGLHSQELASKSLALCLRRLPAPLRLPAPAAGDLRRLLLARRRLLQGRQLERGRAHRRPRSLSPRPRPRTHQQIGVPDPLAPTDGLDRDRWAAREFGSARLRRCTLVATPRALRLPLLADLPMSSFPSPGGLMALTSDMDRQTGLMCRHIRCLVSTGYDYLEIFSANA